MGSASDYLPSDACMSGVRDLSKKLYPLCLVLVGSMNGFKHDLHKQQCHNGTKIV